MRSIIICTFLDFSVYLQSLFSRDVFHDIVIMYLVSRLKMALFKYFFGLETAIHLPTCFHSRLSTHGFVHLAFGRFLVTSVRNERILNDVYNPRPGFRSRVAYMYFVERER